MRTRILLWAALALAATNTLSAQTLGDISGEVRDSSGAVISGVTVTVTNQGTNATRTTTTNDSGLYAFPALVPGPYKIKAEKAGFKVANTEQIDLQVQQQARMDVTMTIGQVSESIEVSASAAQLSTENATVGTVVGQKQIVELPLNGRNYLQLTALAPNVSYGFPTSGQSDARQGGDRSAQNISVAGMRNNFNRFTLDGVENTDPNFNSYVINPSAEALQEFKVQTGVYPAEFGRGATQINVSTKSGTNQFHGAAYEFLRNKALDARPYDFIGRPFAKNPFKWNQFGFTLGGPVWIPKLFNGKNKLFFMTNYEWFRQRLNTQGLFNLPTAAVRSGNYNETTGGIFDPLTRSVQGGTTTATQFPNNTIPQSRIHPTSVKLLEFYPAPNGPGFTQNYNVSQGRPINKDQFIQRFDFNESSNSQWFGRYSRSDENQTSEALAQNGTAIVTKATQWMATNTRVLSNAIVNETRFGFTKFYNTTGPQLAFTRDVVGSLGIRGLASGPPVQWGIPGIVIAGYSGFGNSSEGPYENDNSAMQIINNLSWIRGKHSFKFGGEIRRDAYNQVGNQFARGEFQFTNQATRNPGLTGAAAGGNAFADYQLGLLNQSEAAVAIATAKFRSTGFAFYVDDTWRVTSKLTLALGLRYENTPPWTDQTGNLFNGIVPNDIRPNRTVPVPVQDRSLHPFFLRQGAPRQNCYEGIALRWTNIDVKCDGSLGNRLVGRDNNDWAPRIGISYQLNQKTVIRTGAGMFYSQDTGNPRFDMARNLAGRLRANPSANPDLTWDNGLASIAGGVANVPTPYTFANPYDRRTPYTMQFLLNVQRELGKGLTAEAGYLGNISHRLEGLRAVNESLPACRNIPAATDPSFARCSADPLRGIAERQRAPFPQFGRIQLVDNGNNANYHSLGSKLTKRYSAGLTFLASYTYSKSLDTSSGIRVQGNDTLFPQNSYCRACEYGRSAFDVRHRFVTSSQYELPFGKGKWKNINNKALDAIAGGWSLGSIVTLQTGFAQTVSQSGDPSNTGGQFDRPTATSQVVPLSGSDRNHARWFNTAGFTLTPDGVFGNVGRGTLTLPGIIQWDFIGMKSFKMPVEGHSLQFRFEGYNFPNHLNFGSPDTGILSGGIDPATGVGRNFGRITGGRGMRNLQLALRYSF